jgi:4-hydroxyproline epimerase
MGRERDVPKSSLRHLRPHRLVLRTRVIAAEIAIPRSLRIVDSHTAGEPTRVVLPSGTGPDLGRGSLAERFERLRTRYDHLRRAILCEPRGSDVLVGAWLLEPDDADCAAAVIFFNNAGYLGMCGHGTIGLAATLAHLGRIAPGEHRIQTPVGIVLLRLDSPNRVTIHNVPAYRYRTGVKVDVPGYGSIIGDVAWGGNWFFLAGVEKKGLDKSAVDDLTAFTWSIRQALVAAGVTGAEGAEIDHIEIFTPPRDARNHSRNFVLCPGKAYDRSPCGTGTSAKLACLAADGKLEPGQIWRQEGILGSVFESSYRRNGGAVDGKVDPSITGSAFITAESTLLFDPGDPFHAGIPE